jgi:broad specificity phosphatase PhoE
LQCPFAARAPFRLIRRRFPARSRRTHATQGFLVRLAVASVREALRFFTADSVFVDSPLSSTGASQAAALSVFLNTPKTEKDGLSKAETEAHALVRAAPGAPPSVVVASNLRRAIATAGIGLAERLRRTGESVHVLTPLQEISPNIDALSITPAFTSPVLPGLGLRCESGGNTGNKPLRGTGAPRLASFAAWCFERPNREAVVATGHSLWLRSFVDAYLPRTAPHEARRRKVANCAVLAFTLQRGRVGETIVYRIPPESICMLYGGYH